MKKDLKYYLKRAQSEGWAIGQFNFSTLEQLRAILAAGAARSSPLILGTSEGESRYLGFREILALLEITNLRYKIPAFLNLDHGKDIGWLKEAIKFGYPAVHFDGSALLLEENIKIIKNFSAFAHKKGVVVEGELGAIKGESILHEGIAEIKKEDLTRPNDVENFVERTKIDTLAISIGSAHGLYAGGKNIDLDLLSEIRSRVSVFLVLHGGSGIPDEQIKNAIARGIVKINFNTEMRLAWKSAIESSFLAGEMKPYKVLSYAQESIQKKVEEKIVLLRSENKV